MNNRRGVKILVVLNALIAIFFIGRIWLGGTTTSAFGDGTYSEPVCESDHDCVFWRDASVPAEQWGCLPDGHCGDLGFPNTRYLGLGE